MDGTEQRILDAAMRVFASEGYEGATTRRIAQEANVTEVTLFRRFQSKENILREVIIRNRDSALSALDPLFQVDKDADLATSLRILCQYIVKGLRERKDLIFILIEEGRRRPEVAEVLSSIPRMIIARLSEYFDEQIKNGKMRDINPSSAALVFFSYPYYINLLTGIFGDDILGDKERGFEDFMDIFIKGIQNSEKVGNVREKSPGGKA